MKFFFKQINEKNFLKEGFIWGIGTSFLNFIFVILLNFILVQIMGLNKFGELYASSIVSYTSVTSNYKMSHSLAMICPMFGTVLPKSGIQLVGR